MGSNNDVIIIGGGIIGLACAHYLIEKKASVRMIEQDLIGSGASHGNCGLLHFSGIIPLCSPGVVKHEIYRALRGNSPLYIKPTLDIQLIQWLVKFARHCNPTHMTAASKAKNDILKYSLELYNTLFSEYPLECEFEKKGLLLLFKEKKYFEKYKSTNDFLQNYNFGAKLLDKTEAQKLEPAISKNIKGAWFNAHDWHLRPEMLINSWKDILVKKGLVIEENCKMLDFGIENNKISHVNTVKGQYKADTFILTTGAWAPEVNKQLCLNIPVQPGKGYSITMERPDQSPEIPCLLYERNMVATPWKTGYRLGGTMEFSGFNDVLNKKRLSKLVKGANEYLNARDIHPVLEEWSGLRPMTYDDLPIIGKSSFQNNLFIATGHGMLGITMATGTGKTICDMIDKGKSQIELTPFSVERF
ncbi:MAG: FAD-binding oxidoreductase [Desulfobacteraceae bacterium]|nr:FAD-binding oxidoreductase [Desulfobacteraceae bacterium]